MSTNWLDNTNTDTLPQITQSALYIYKRSTIACFEQRHQIIDVLATYQSINNMVIKLPAQYCIDCDKLLISEEEFKKNQGMIRYHFIPTRIRYIDSGKYYSPTDNPFVNYRDEESPLMLCGYSVRQKDAIPRNIRQDILRFIIERGILSRVNIIKYLELFINTNGMRRNMEYAVQKWKEDLHFVYLHDFQVQATAQVTSIRPYRR